MTWHTKSKASTKLKAGVPKPAAHAKTTHPRTKAAKKKSGHRAPKLRRIF